MPDKTEIETRVIKVIAKVLNKNIEEISAEQRIKEDLGAESIDIITMILELEDEFNSKIVDEEAEKLVTVSDISAYIASSLKS